MAARGKTKKVEAAAVIEPAPELPIVAYKGFDANLRCHGGYQYEVGQTYVHTGPVVQCASGFHACQNPLDVLDFYGLAGGNRFARVTVSGKIDRSDDKKWAAAQITIDAELKLPDLISSAIAWIKEACKVSPADVKAGGAISSGHSATNASSGYSAKNASSGDYATNASSGHSATNASSGYSAKNASSGDYATNASSGYYATNASSGHSAKNASSGHSAKNASSGYYAKNASSGDSATNASSGDYATNASSGDYATNEATGQRSAIAAAGLNSRANGAKGTAIALPYRDSKDQIRFACGVAGEKGVPADTWLIAKSGKLVKA